MNGSISCQASCPRGCMSGGTSLFFQNRQLGVFAIFLLRLTKTRIFVLSERSRGSQMSLPRAGRPQIDTTRNRILGILSETHSVGVLDSGGAFRDAPVACFRGRFRRKRGPKMGHWRRPASGRVLESLRPQIPRFRADLKMWDFPETSRRGNPEIGFWGFSQKFMALAYWILAACFRAAPSHVSEGTGEN